MVTAGTAVVITMAPGWKSPTGICRRVSVSTVSSRSAHTATGSIVYIVLTGIITADVTSGPIMSAARSGKRNAGMTVGMTGKNGKTSADTTGKNEKMIVGMISRSGRKKNRTENMRSTGETDIV